MDSLLELNRGKLEGPDYASGPVSLTRRRIYILPTVYGLAFAFTLLVMLVGSINYNNSLGYMLCFLLGGMALISIFHTYRNLAGLKLLAGRAEPVFAGESARLTVCLENRAHSARPGLVFEYLTGLVEKRRRKKGIVGTSVARQDMRCVELPRPARLRGLLKLGKFTVKTRYPLGLFWAWSPVTMDLQCMVYPRPEGRLPLPAITATDPRLGQIKGQGEEDFSGFRDFTPGDPPRRVYWKALAREQRMLVKVFTGGGQGDLILRWEDAGDGQTEARLSQLCRWIIEANRLRCNFGLRLPGIYLAPSQGESHTRRCLETLALFGNHDGR